MTMLPPCLDAASNPSRSEDIRMFVLSVVTRSEQRQLLREWSHLMPMDQIVEMALICGFRVMEIT